MRKKAMAFHNFQQDISTIQVPDAFTFPFCYEPHPLTILAAEQLQDYLQGQQDFTHNFGLDHVMSGLVIGKMFGVLVVRDPAGQLGFIAAFSGKLA